MSGRLIDEAVELNPNSNPWKVIEGPEHLGEDWLIADMGVCVDGVNRYITTDHVHASEMGGSVSDDAAWIVWVRNHWCSILEALDANGSPAGTDEEKMEARRKLAAWNSGEAIRGGVVVEELESVDARGAIPVLWKAD